MIFCTNFVMKFPVVEYFPVFLVVSSRESQIAKINISAVGTTAESSSAPCDDISDCTEHTFCCFPRNPFYGHCPAVDKTSQRSARRDTGCNLFMEAWSENNSVDIWSLTYLVSGHKGPGWNLPKRSLEGVGVGWYQKLSQANGYFR